MVPISTECGVEFQLGIPVADSEINQGIGEIRIRLCVEMTFRKVVVTLAESKYAGGHSEKHTTKLFSVINLCM